MVALLERNFLCEAERISLALKPLSTLEKADCFTLNFARPSCLNGHLALHESLRMNIPHIQETEDNHPYLDCCGACPKEAF